MLPRQPDHSLPFVAPTATPLSVHLLGLVDFESCLALQHRLVYETAGRNDGHVTLLLCEHPATITIGRHGSRADVHIDAHELTSRGIPVRWASRGGATLLHLPGQLAAYPIVPLEARGYSVGQYLARLQSGMMAALAELGVVCQTHTGHYGIWGRTGQLAAIGAAVRNWVSYFGAYINVCPEMQLYRKVASDLADPTGDDRSAGRGLSSLVVERQQPVRMAGVRERLVRHLAAAFDCDRFHLYTGHPLLARTLSSPPEASARVG
jgi:lipoyl(octanoyl) transferase